MLAWAGTKGTEDVDSVDLEKEKLKQNNTHIYCLFKASPTKGQGRSGQEPHQREQYSAAGSAAYTNSESSTSEALPPLGAEGAFNLTGGGPATEDPHQRIWCKRGS